jgi:hypothetical protein
MLRGIGRDEGLRYRRETGWELIFSTSEGKVKKGRRLRPVSKSIGIGETAAVSRFQWFGSPARSPGDDQSAGIPIRECFYLEGMGMVSQSPKLQEQEH